MQKVSEAIILAGGKGKRMRTVTQDRIPKSLTIIQNRSILSWELDWLAREGVSHVILATGHLSEEIVKEIGAEYQSKFGKIDISISEEKGKLGSGGAVKLASTKIGSDRSYIVNGDILCNSSLEPMQKIHTVENASATMFLVKMRSPYGVVLSKQNRIIEFKEKPLLDVYIHGGIDIVEVEEFNRFPTKGQMEDTIFVEFVKEDGFASYNAPESEFWISIDSEKDYDNANNDWPGI
ncbi:MAG: nucleotidyltransferase family protein [Candidatus Heimdallarchaeota archaeon]|nr:nucleotidyltransferase family protein [Candidatus Heimdallarchaeota archaeon]